MRFIAFYLTNEDIADNKDKVINWFKKAYPGYQVESIIVTSRTNKSLADVDALPTEPDPGYKGRIDIVFNCEKLCMSYHSGLITGLILDRKTLSLAKYMQMIGRLLSCDDDEPVVIFDIVDNIHSDFVCKTPHLKEEKTVQPLFSEKISTFAELVNAYPNARHWDEIKRHNAKAKKSEKIITDAEVLSHEAPIVPIIKDDAAAPLYQPQKEEIKQEAKQAIQDAWDVVKEKNMTFSEACNFLADIQDEYGTVDPHEDEYEQEEERVLNPYSNTFPRSAGLRTSVNNVDKKQTSEKESVTASGPEAPANKEVSSTNSHQEPESLGYQTTYYLDPDTKALYSKNVQVMNKRTNFEEDIKAALEIVAKSTLDKIIKKWHEYPTCEDNYTDYTQIDKKSAKYKFLKSCSEFLYGVKVEETLYYMIEGKIA